MLAGVGSKDSPRLIDDAALVVFQQRFEIGRLGNHGAVGGRVGNVVAHRAVGGLEVRLGHAHQIGRLDVLEAVVLQEHQPPVALRDGRVESAGGDGLRVGEAVLQVAQKPGPDALHLFPGGGIAGHGFDGLDQGLAGFIERLIFVQGGCQVDQSGIVQLRRGHAGRFGLLGLDQRFVETPLAAAATAPAAAATTAAAHDAGQHLERGRIGVAGGRAVVCHDHFLPLAHAAQLDEALAILGGSTV